MSTGDVLALLSVLTAGTAMGWRLARVRARAWGASGAERLGQGFPSLAGTESLRDVLDSIVRGFSAGADGAPAVLRLYDPRTRLFEARAFAQVDESARGAVSNQDVTREQFDALAADASRTGCCLRVESTYAFGDQVLRTPSRGLVLVPLEDRGVDPLGYVAMAVGGERVAWRLGQSRGLEALAAYAVLAIDRAMLRGELESRALALAAASRNLKELERLKDNFLSTVSHELRTPLTSVKAYAETLLRQSGELDEPTAREFARVIVQESDRLNQVFDNILRMSPLENGRGRMVSQDFSVLDVCREVAERIEPELQRKGIGFELVAPRADVMLHGDRSALHHVIHNLLDNAGKFTDSGGHVRLLLDEDRELVRILVEDSGIGIPGEEAERVFDRFYQVDGSSTRSYGGPGLGLAVCRDVVNWHCGRIWSEPAPEGGSRFVMLLPRHGLIVRPHPRDADRVGARNQREAFYRLATALVAETMRTWIVSIMLVDDDGGGLRIEAALGIPPDVVRDVYLRQGESVAGAVWSEGRSIHVPDLDDDDRFKGRLNEVRYPTRSLLSCPLRLDGEILGVLNVNNKIDGTPFDDGDRLLLEALADRLASGLRDYRVFASSHETLASTQEALQALIDVRRQQVTPLREEVARCGLETARRLELDDADLRALAFALRHYDVGLAGVESALLRCSRPLTSEERLRIQEHVAHGVTLAAALGNVGPILKILLHHHENVDGTGYPHGLRGEAIPLGARIVRLVDTVAALLHGDARREAVDIDVALATVQAGVGRAFCPRLTPLFLEVVTERRDRLEAAAPEDTTAHRAPIVAPATAWEIEPVGAGTGEETR